MTVSNPTVRLIAAQPVAARLVPPDDIPVLVGVAARIVPPTWGLDHVVAVNPLHGFEHLTFEEAVTRSADLHDARGYLPAELLWRRLEAVGARSEHLAAAARELCSARGGEVTPEDAEAWCQVRQNPVVESALDPWRPRPRRPSTELIRHGTDAVADVADAITAHACASAMARHDLADRGGLYRWWRSVAPYDPELRRRSDGVAASLLAALPEDRHGAISSMLAQRGVAPDDVVRYLEAQLCRLPGWASVMGLRVSKGHRHDMVDFVALRLTVEHVLVGAMASGAKPADRDPASAGPDTLDDQQRVAVWQAAAELAYADGLLTRLARRGSAAPVPAMPPAVPDAQVVLCIDVRSEGLRRHLEALGPYETLGFAGFFGLPVAVRPAHAEEAIASCPVILDPKATVTEKVVAGRLRTGVERELSHHGFHTAEVGGASAFALADATGWLLGPRTLATSLAPGSFARVRQWFERLGRRPVTTRFDLETDAASGGLSLDDQVAVAHGALTAMGLTEGFAPLVVFCGHRSENRNNPYRSALDCGACGGNPGGPNARILAAICNRSLVRERLAEVGLAIPPSTRFVAAEHETTDDTVTFLDIDDQRDDGLDDAARERLGRLARDLDRAGRASRAERAERYPASPLPSARTLRSVDPAQVVPDWGLARCAAIVIGHRSLTAGLDLDRRTFLHSYRPELDPEGLVLEAIMTGPVVVAHWISSQYYFSTVDPHRFGAGPKPLHNVIGRLGVAVGASTDVRIGLPLESTWFDGEPVHDPMRLVVVVDAPRARVDAVVDRNPVLRRLFDHGWARVAARDESGQHFVMRDRLGEWRPLPDTSDPEREQAGQDHVETFLTRTR